MLVSSWSLCGVALAAAGAIAFAAASPSPSSLAIDSHLVYDTQTLCTRLTELPSHHALVGMLLPNESFRGQATLTKTPAADEGCLLSFVVNGAIESSEAFSDVFTVVDAMHTALPNLIASQSGLRGAESLSDVALLSMNVAVDSQEYTVATPATQAKASQITVHDTDCNALGVSALLQALAPGETVNVVSNSENCVLGVGTPGESSSLDLATDILALLRAIDDSVRASSNEVEQPTAEDERVREVPEPETAKSESVSMAFNGPTKDTTLGILIGVSILGGMMFAVVYQKKRHDQRCQERHAMASKAAQIRRVSYRMAYERLPRDDEDEEEKEDLL
ncbi:hypothetical protein P43SY_003969 [Pythium insidiosum]|uniref:Transmembrane protein n=1 Tax=Pythium insidiosum TaxID=114742 RepID=A0AAD5LM20_PYTIN|nr:hypothetical protein P43SY_003969 [Pythium insidiosum]